MLYFTKYAESKFDILNKYKVFFTKEQIEDTIASPQKSFKKRKCVAAQKDGLKVLYKKEGDIIKIITFYPVK
jgi:hypothetical protein